MKRQQPLCSISFTIGSLCFQYTLRVKLAPQTLSFARSLPNFWSLVVSPLHLFRVLRDFWSRFIIPSCLPPFGTVPINLFSCDDGQPAGEKRFGLAVAVLIAHGRTSNWNLCS